MSHIGKKSILIPSNVFITLNNNNIKVEGKYGILEQEINDNIKIILKNNILSIFLINKTAKNYYGLLRSLIKNMIIGVNETFKKILILNGIGYKFNLLNNFLILSLGYTHNINIIIPNNINVKLESSTKIQISGINNQKINEFAFKIYNICPPEPYKGKGICFENQIIIKKIGKKSK